MPQPHSTRGVVLAPLPFDKEQTTEMTFRAGAVFIGKRSVAAVLAAVLICTAAAVAMARSTGARVGTAQEATYGAILVGGNGHTLYMRTRDQWNKSTCYGACAKTWSPDYTHGHPTVVSGSGLNPQRLGTTRRRNGSLQVTFRGHPLYFYSGDPSSGDMFGEGNYGFGAYWYVLGPLGKAKKPGFSPGSY